MIEDCAVLVVRLLKLTLAALSALILFPTANCLAQTNMDETLDWVSSPMREDIKERLTRGLSDLEQKLGEMEPKIKQRMQQYAHSGAYQVGEEHYSDQPQRHPLLDRAGVSDSSQQDYTDQDTRVIFNQETFEQCFEERQVTTGPYVDECANRCVPGWVTYVEGNPGASCLPCVRNPLGGLECRYNQFYVSEYYWPIYESRTYPARAMGSFDPRADYLHTSDRQSGEYDYEQARISAYKRHTEQHLPNFYNAVYNEDLPPSTFKQAVPEEHYFAADYTGRDLHVGEGNPSEVQANHTLVYMTNTNRQLSRRMRPGAANIWKGYVMEDKCFFNTLPNADKLAASHATYDKDHEVLTYQYMHQEVTEPPGVKPRGSAYGTAMLEETNVYSMEEAIDRQFEQSGDAQPDVINNMLGQYVRMNAPYYKKGMEEFGVSDAEHYQDWLYHNFFRLYHSRSKEMLEDPLYAKIVSGFSFYTLNSLPTYGPNLKDAGRRRPTLWSFYAGRPHGKTGSYAGSVRPVAPQNFFSVDKIQIIFPTINDGTRGSSCFRPESLAKSEYFDIRNRTIDNKVGTQGFWGFRRDLNKRLLDMGIEDAHQYVREVRIAYWTKRVNCHCTICAKDGFPGCSVLNTGDHPDDWFYGTRSLAGQPPILEPLVTLKEPIPQPGHLKP